MSADEDELVDCVARKLRIAYGLAVPSVQTHLAAAPWEMLTEFRKRKWRMMAKAAIEELKTR